MLLPARTHAASLPMTVEVLEEKRRRATAADASSRLVFPPRHDWRGRRAVTPWGARLVFAEAKDGAAHALAAHLRGTSNAPPLNVRLCIVPSRPDRLCRRIQCGNSD